jgi:hypothetical protein
MKQAIRENRQGKVRVADYLLFDAAPEAALLCSRMEVFKVIHDERSAWFVGYAPEFEPLVVGERPPEYEAIFMLPGGGPTMGMVFQRVGEDRRIEEFKEAGASGAQVYIISETTWTVPDGWTDAENTIDGSQGSGVLS